MLVKGFFSIALANINKPQMNSISSLSTLTLIHFSCQLYTLTTEYTKGSLKEDITEPVFILRGEGVWEKSLSSQ